MALSARRQSKIEAVSQEIQDIGGRSLAVTCDVTDQTEIDDALAQIAEKFGAPTILINNAGVAESHKFETHPDELWNRMIAVNLTGTFQMCRACAPGMLEAGWGRVVNIGSVASMTGAPYIAAYTAAKHGVLGLTRSLAAEWARKGITVNMIAPGYVDTPMTRATIENIAERTGRSEDDAESIVEGMSPQGRLVQPEEVAAWVGVLCSALGATTTGSVIAVDGGASAFAAKG